MVLVPLMSSQFTVHFAYILGVIFFGLNFESFESIVSKNDFPFEVTECIRRTG